MILLCNINQYLIFKNYKNSLGGGIWFEPYVINPQKRLVSTYAYRNKSGEIVLDKDFESEKYNYLNKNWYREIKPNLSKERPLAWSLPYYEKEGSDALMITVGSGIYHNDKLIGISTVDWEITSIVKTISEMKPTPGSFTLLLNVQQDYVISSADKYNKNNIALGAPLKEIQWYSPNLKNGETFTYQGVKYISFIKQLNNGMTLLVNVPEKELLNGILQNIYITFLILVLICILISIAIYMVLQANITNPINKLMNATYEIGQGNLDKKIYIDNPKEFSKLATTFNEMTDDIKDYIENLNKINQEKQKIKSELTIARNIQYSVVPKNFYTERKEFDIFATMETAKEVGGDFYDFFFIDNDHLMFLIADVSGKGIPAALFMMISKTLIKNIAKEGYTPNEMIKKINNQICENNKQDYFVTMLAGIININTGKTSFINAGHNPPLIKKANGNFEYLTIPPNLVLGIKNDLEYKIQETTFEQGDTIFLYTDGVTEAVNNKEELYGENRLQECLNKTGELSLNDTLITIKDDINEFVGETEQSDDITMLVFKYNGNNPAEKFKTVATKENYPSFYNWLKNICDRNNFSQQIVSKIELVSEEIYTNVSKYAYENENGQIEITFNTSDNKISIQFVDEGKMFNPLNNEEVDITKNYNEREIGGLGVHLVKKSVDEIYYKYENNKNILTAIFHNK